MDYLMSILLAVIFLVSIFFIYNWLFASWNYWTSRGIPNVPGALPIVGNTLSVVLLQGNFGTYCKSIYQTYQNCSMVGFYKMKKPVLMVREPELVKTVLQSSFKNFQHNEAVLDRDSDPLIGGDIFFIRGQAWKDARVHFTSAFSSKRLKNLANVISEVCKKLENYLKEKIGNEDYLELEAKLLFSRYTTEVAASSVFSIEGNSFHDNYTGTLLGSMKETMDPSTIKAFVHNAAFFFPALSRFTTSTFVSPAVDKFYRGVVEDVENCRQNDGIVRSDVLQLMMDLEKNGKIPRADVLSHTFSFFLESYETSSLTLSFVMYALAKHPKIQNELRSEIESVLGKYEGQTTYEAINELSYTEQVLNETLRLYSPVGALSKLCAEKYRLEGSDGLSVEVEPDTVVVIPISGLHMDPQIWDNPEEFDPERFRKGNTEDRHKFAYLPFGEGPRACPGMRLAYMQVKAAIATIVVNYRIELSPKMKEPLFMDPHYFMTTVLGGFWIKLHPLKNH